jgi:hypothetical protein
VSQEEGERPPLEAWKMLLSINSEGVAVETNVCV